MPDKRYAQSVALEAIRQALMEKIHSEGPSIGASYRIANNVVDTIEEDFELYAEAFRAYEAQVQADDEGLG